MTREEFNSLLDKAGLTKKQFCETIGLNYNTINTWGSSNIKIPAWVKTWLINYAKAKSFDEMGKRFKELEEADKS